MPALFAWLIPFLTSNVPIVVKEIRAYIDNAHQNKELTDEEHASLVALFIQTAQTDPAWRPSTEP